MKHRNAFLSTSRFLRAALVLLSMGLTACAQLNNQFDCPHKATGVCASMNEVYKRSQTGDLPSLQQRQSVSAAQPAPTASFATTANPSLASVSAPRRVGIVSPALRPAPVGITPIPASSSMKRQADSLPARQPEKVLRVWVAPFEDTQGNYHQGTHILAVVAPGAWSTHPVKALAENEGEQPSANKGRGY